MVNKMPIRLQTYYDESLSSFLIRIAKANGVEVLKFLNNFRLNEYRYSQKTDIPLLDLSLIINISKFSKASGLQEEVLLSKTFYCLISKFSMNNEVNRNRLLSGMIRQEYYYCPICVNEKPYNRLLWSLKGINFCNYHNQSLQSSCGKCKKVIKICDVRDFNVCPYCKERLYDLGNKTSSFEKGDKIRSEWTYETISIINTNDNLKYTPQELAFKFLYILNAMEIDINLGFIKSNNSMYGAVIPQLLQHARDSMYEKKSFHLSFVLDFLYRNRVPIKEFLSISPPQDFIASIIEKQRIKKEKYFCLAPWCDSYYTTGSLEKTGTSFKTKNNSEVLRYYMICKSCGCKYALNEHNVLVERTYFIKIFEYLSSISNSNIKVKTLAQQSPYSVDQFNRAFAYFRTRDQFNEIDIYKEFVLDEIILKEFIAYIKMNKTIKEIRERLSEINSHEFLTYRYHIQVILMEQASKKKIEGKSQGASNKEKVHKILYELLESDQDITLKNVCKHLSVCTETLRNWGCNALISEMKEIQKEKRKIILKDRIYKQIDNYIANENESDSNSLYKIIGIGRTALWRMAPELTSCIHYKINKLKNNLEGC